MNASELVIKMLQWEKKKRILDEIEQEIKDAVLEIGKTQTAGLVRAIYFKGRAKYDYEIPGTHAPQEIINNHSHSEIEIDWMEVAKEAGYTTEMRENHTRKIIFTEWAKVCKEAEIDPLVLDVGEPKVKVKLLE